MKKQIALALAAIALISGCGSNGTNSSLTPVSGAVADGYLQNALVFLDKNGNYQQDQGEPSATTDANGAYTLNIPASDVGLYPIVAVAIKDQTIDKDTGLAVANTYVLCTPGAGVSGTVSNFISPISTLLREKLEATPGMTLAEAAAQVRNQLNMPAGMDMTANYVAGETAGQFRTQYQAMHQVAQQMAALMGAQAGLVMNGTSANGPRFRSMMGEINSNLSQIADNAGTGGGMNSAFMNSMRSQMQSRIGGVPVTSGFGNYTAMFRNMTGHRFFWNYSGGRMRPTGMMGMR